MSVFSKFKQVFSSGKSKEDIKAEKAIIQNQSQKEMDKTLKDSFPASDPPGNY